ncbi:MAG: hypothetical protein QM781_08825 [Chitinophagaceae bacterium]
MLADPEPGDERHLAALSAMFPYMETELGRTGVTRWILWGEYKQKHPDGFSYSRFCDHFKQYKISRSGSLRFEYKPADKLFIDFTGKKLAVVDSVSGELTEVEIYVAILGYSQLTYVQAVASRRKEDFIAATENALHFFGGVPQVLIPDNLKSEGVGIFYPVTLFALPLFFLDFLRNGHIIVPGRITDFSTDMNRIQT